MSKGSSGSNEEKRGKPRSAVKMVGSAVLRRLLPDREAQCPAATSRKASEAILHRKRSFRGRLPGAAFFPGVGGSPCSEPTEAADEKGPGIVIRGSRRVQCQKVRVSPSSGMITLPHTPRSVRRFFMSGREIVAWATASM